LGAVLLLLFPTSFTLSQGVQDIALHFMSVVKAALSLCITLYLRLYKVVVEGRSIQVRKGIWKKFTLDAAEMGRVDWIRSTTIFGGQNDNIPAFFIVSIDNK
jgi:hypothetical protein